MTSKKTNQELTELAADLKIILLDVDGVLTDGGIILIGAADEAKRFDVQDGMGVNLARSAGLKVGIITSRSSEVVQRRARELKIDEVFQGAGRKEEVLGQILKNHQISPAQAAYIGDDIQDIPIMRRVGIPIAVQNAVQETKDISLYVTKACGGHGAVREAVEWLLELRGDKQKTIHQVTG